MPHPLLAYSLSWKTATKFTSWPEPPKRLPTPNSPRFPSPPVTTRPTNSANLKWMHDVLGALIQSLRLALLSRQGNRRRNHLLLCLLQSPKELLATNDRHEVHANPVLLQQSRKYCLCFAIERHQQVELLIKTRLNLRKRSHIQYQAQSSSHFLPS